MKRKMIDIDGNKMRSALKRRNMAQEKTSVELGYSRAQLANCIATGRLSEAIAVALESKYGINRSEYTTVKEEKPSDMAIMVAKMEAMTQAIKELTDRVGTLERMWN